MIELDALPEVDPERSREAIAHQLGWPEGAIEECRRVEAQEPGYHIWYVTGGSSWRPEPGFTARQGDDACGKTTRLFAPTADELLRVIQDAKPNPPHDG